MSETVVGFDFLQAEWPEVFEAADKAYRFALADPVTACIHARRALEMVVKWVYDFDPSLSPVADAKLNDLLNIHGFKSVAPEPVFQKAKVVQRIGNRAVHNERVTEVDSKGAVTDLSILCWWLAFTYTRSGDRLTTKPLLRFEDVEIVGFTRRDDERQVAELVAELAERDRQLAEWREQQVDFDAERRRLRAEIAAAKAANTSTPAEIDYSEAETRRRLIDEDLRLAGWDPTGPNVPEYEVSGMPNTTGVGYVDYVLWGEDGRPLAVVEAKKAIRSPREGQEQARLYADCLEQQFGRRPVIYYTNGYEHFFWDDTAYPPRQVDGFRTRDELELLIGRRETARPLADAEVNPGIAGRPYQVRAIKRVAESFERDHRRKALLVMATGTGKTRVAVALSELLMRCNWAKRILFLADRKELVKQATTAFQAYLPDVDPVNLLEDKESDSRVYVATYPTIVNLIDQHTDGGERRFGPGHFDLVIIDEAHRSVFRKYKAIFEYFDSLLLGLTATPADEVDRNTYDLFDLEPGVPTDAYTLDEAVADGYLVPPVGVAVPLKFPRAGISYDELSPEEQAEWNSLDWGDEEEPPPGVTAEEVNRFLFNKHTVDTVIEHLMTNGDKVAGGDRLAKTIIFAKSQAHAEFIEERFNKHHPHLAGTFARVITYKTEYADELIKNFKQPDSAPHIAISVDMLDTGVDVPEVANLVFFKPVGSKIKFWQMVGRGTRLRPDLYGPGRDKSGFLIFDYCGNLEYFTADIAHGEAGLGQSLSASLFATRVELLGTLERGARSAGLQADITALLSDTVSAMPTENFQVRRHLEHVHRFAAAEAWQGLAPEAAEEAVRHLAGLPADLPADKEESKRFDLLLLRTQLAVLTADPGFTKLQARIQEIAGLLAAQASIPMIKAELGLIEQLETDGWWADVTPEMLEEVRLRLRALVPLIEKRKRAIVYTDFEDRLVGAEQIIELVGVGGGVGSLNQFRREAQEYLQAHLNHVAVRKLRTNRQLTPADLEELERIFLENGIGDPAVIKTAAEEAGGLGLFVRRLVGLEQAAVNDAFAEFLGGGRNLTANQIAFLDLVVKELTTTGVMEPGRLFEAPFTDGSSTGPVGLFPDADVAAIVDTLTTIRDTATPKAG